LPPGCARASRGGSSFDYDFGQEEAKHAGHKSLVQPWVETAVYVSVYESHDKIRINLLSRDMRERRGNVVNPKYKESVATRLLMCFALALGAHLLKRSRTTLRDSKVTLTAADKGSGSLLTYYSDKYGLEVVRTHEEPIDEEPIDERYPRMEGSLLEALWRCDAVWDVPAVQERSHEHLV
jgi:hypothetical protein